MMNKPTLDELMTRVDSRYTLVVAAAKRARMLTEEEMKTNQSLKAKPVTLALEEIAKGLVTYRRTRSGQK
ncbi:DNA-directed RNA polymerase subunit omega [Desulforamulus hydrothermalis]|uniref:DNA-directed RNA polymerase subunit omega n=1 Tax=Desulforamulus hydrothermalis Lam5 = DSM 18033 TaxID=1121428 RepID=K8DXB4_9FIRM|nr:DNA-directed RNA polymerase subunit omega [Desulforamulus hydrothermalis]CCO07189.1 DNA-directed RNA polymerase subunit omega [Desulforamulus hydrothermalis Lam5 = DSM 18033]SHG88201.1 DNA-directed RNA polymerase subunit omega [Desulforamulus hydrothermalis Lam5 = DSM 18033]